MIVIDRCGECKHCTYTPGHYAFCSHPKMKMKFDMTPHVNPIKMRTDCPLQDAVDWYDKYKFYYTNDDGKCFKKCEFGWDCMVGSPMCQDCPCNLYSEIKKEFYIICINKISDINRNDRINAIDCTGAKSADVGRKNIQSIVRNKKKPRKSDK